MSGKRFAPGKSFNFSPKAEEAEALNELYLHIPDRGREKLTNAQVISKIVQLVLDPSKGVDPKIKELASTIQYLESEQSKLQGLLTQEQETVKHLREEIHQAHLLQDPAKEKKMVDQLAQVTLERDKALGELDEQSQEVQRLTDQARQLQELQGQFHEQIQALQSETLDPQKAFIVTMTPFESHLILQTAAKESDRLKKPIDPATLLKQMLLSYYMKGAHDHFPRPFDRDDLRKLARQYAHAEAQQAEPTQTPA